MDTNTSTMDDGGLIPETDVVFSPEEIEGIKLAIAQADAGLTVDFDDVEAWLDSLDTDQRLPRPVARAKP